jgi:hypothetical protein
METREAGSAERPTRVPGSATGTWLAWLDRIGSSGWLTWPQAAVVVLALVVCFRGDEEPLRWMLLALALPVVRFVLAPSYRRRTLAWLGQPWHGVPSDPAAARRIPWGAAFVLVVLPSAVLFLSNNERLGAGDSWPVIPTACSLVREGRWDVEEYLHLWNEAGYPRFQEPEVPYCTARRGEHVYADYPQGMVVFAFPVVAVARLVGADLEDWRVPERLEKWTAAWVAALTLGLFFLLALYVAEPTAALITTLILASGSAMFSIAGQALWQQGGVAFWSLVLLLVEFRSWQRPTTASVLLQGLACGMLLACRLSTVPLLGAFGIWVLLRSPKRGLLLAAAGLAAFAPWAWLYWSIYGTPLGPAVSHTAGRYWSEDVGTALLGVLISPGRGLFVYQPWIVFAFGLCLPAVYRAKGQPDLGKCPTGWAWFCVIVLAAHLCMLGQWRCWWGGWSWGSRLMADVIPLAALLAARPIAVAWRSIPGRCLIGAVAVLSLLVHVPFVYLNANPWGDAESMWLWSEPPFLQPVQHRGQ